MTRILVVDNYDSFAYNLVQYVGEFADEVDVYRNDALTTEDIRNIDPDGIVISPGPGTPADAGISIPTFRDLDYPTLGVCLGHQSLCAALGAHVGHAPEVVHGKPSLVEHDGKGVFTGLPDRIEVGRYHSLAVELDDIPDELVVTAYTVGDESGGDTKSAVGADDTQVVMGVRHREKPHVGVQFHPESILTESGKAIVRNFVALAAGESPVADTWQAREANHE
ncbi:anthranilate/aminodeoxychorismate synthase component II [Haloferax sp. MBLA0076]|uniref:anthranilate synthase n=1 Tax=Haloferax litoreum TaxID=2666140 RepID=A0A6A8GCB1_9EURY|nr:MULTISPECIES: aminodeoxychorismate/anthranilate synthase component II [Haloferax]KAB1192240.1 aminodeoxychorismate/anthranilate synthase component II [Haloferax sp. CBA1148]MRX20695.1 anthranilate/aminodeoxychorismate synthase component II [Haloferax litoreum]